MMRAAVVILNWNGRRHLERFLGSVVTRTPRDIRIVVADNGSTDDSVALPYRRNNTPRPQLRFRRGV